MSDERADYIPHGRNNRCSQGYYLPTGLRVQDDTPFWVAVALWGWQLGAPFSRQDILVAFRVERLVAANVFHYIRYVHGKKLAVTEHHRQDDSGRIRCCLQVNAPPPGWDIKTV